MRVTALISGTRHRMAGRAPIGSDPKFAPAFLSQPADKLVSNLYPTIEEVRSAPGTEPGGSATIYKRRHGKMMKTVTVPLPWSHRPLPLGDSFLLWRERKFSKVDRQGKVEFELEKPSGCKSVHYHGASNQILTLSNNRLRAYDAESGEKKGALEFDGEPTVLSADQQLLIFDQGKVTAYNGGLEKTGEYPTQLKASEAHLLDNGNLLLQGGGVELVSPSGESLFHQQGWARGKGMDGQGRLHFAMGNQWHQVDAKTGEARVVELQEEARDLIPLSDGRVLVQHWRDYTESKYCVYTGNGRVSQSFTIHGNPLKVEVSKDGEQVYLLTSRRRADTQTLYGVKLKDDSLLSGFGNLSGFRNLSGFGNLAGSLGFEAGEVLHRTRGHYSDRFAQLANGELVLSGSEGLTRISPTGRVLSRHHDLQDFIEEHSQELHPTPLREKGQTLEAELRRTEKSSDYVKLDPVMERRGATLCPGGVKFVEEASEFEFGRALEEKVEARPEMLFDKRLKHRLVSANRPGTVEVVPTPEGDIVVVEIKISETAGKRLKFFPDDMTEVTHVLPVDSGDHSLLAVATKRFGSQKGELYIFEQGESPRPLTSFQLEGCVEGLELSDEGTLVARTGAGEELHWRGPTALQTAWRHGEAVEKPLFDEEIVFEENVLKVGDFDLDVY